MVYGWPSLGLRTPSFVCIALVLLIGGVLADPGRYTSDLITQWTNQNKLWLAENGLWGLGIGEKYEPRCAPAISRTLEYTPAYVQTAMQMATTLATLLPTLLTIGNWNQAKSSEVFSTSFLVGISTAALSFTLPAKTRSGVHPRQRLDVARLPDHHLQRLRQFGEKRKSTRPQPGLIQRTMSLTGLRETPTEFGAEDAEHQVKLDELTEWSQGTCGSLQFKALSEMVERFRTRATLYLVPRNLWWIVPPLFFCVQSTLLLTIALPPAYYILAGWPLYDCTTQGVTWWMLASVVVSVCFKAASWELSGHEIVRLHLLTERETGEIRKELFHDGQQSVEMGIPPLLITYLNPLKIAFRRVRPYYAWLKYLVLHPRKLISWTGSGRRKPAVIMVHLVEEAKSPLPSFLSSFIQGAVLLGLTFFFGSFWAGSLYRTMIYIGYVLVAVFIGRVVGVAYVMWSEHANGFTVINCHEVEEVRGILRVLATMPNVMVEVNQRYYVDGRRIDHFHGFQRWLQVWEYNVHRGVDPTSLAQKAASKGAPAITVTTEPLEGASGESTAVGDPNSATPSEQQAWADHAHAEIDEAARRSVTNFSRPTTPAGRRP